MDPIGAEEAALNHNIHARHSRLDTGELRFRLMCGRDGNGYVRTEAAASGWQRSHFHKRTLETYIVERGWMMLAVAPSRASGKPHLQYLGPRSLVTTSLHKVHNVYLPKGAVVHTVKHGGRIAEDDWHAAPAFDEILLGHGPKLIADARATARRARLRTIAF